MSRQLLNNVGGTNGLEGDAGNYGYSSDVSGVISFAGGINDVNWIDHNDEPLVSCQGTDDLTVNYNCGPGLNNSSLHFMWFCEKCIQARLRWSIK